MPTVIINSDELTAGEDHVYSREMNGYVHDLISGCRRITVQLDSKEVTLHEYDKPERKLGKLRRITYKEAEDCPFIIKVGEQRDAEYYGVFDV